MADDPALFEAFPGLKERLPRRPFLDGPTAVEPLALAGVPTGALWVKRDDRTSRLYGGNKPRKLEFVIGAALARGARRLVTTGGLGTHHGLATTILGREAGLATTLVLVRQPVTDAVRGTLALHAAWGATLVYGGNVPGTALQTARVLAVSWLRRERPFLVATGGSSPTGTVGFVSAGLELARQVRAGEAPEPAEIWVAVGTGGTHAGLVLGLRLAGLATRVRGVLVTDILPPSSAGLRRAARRTLARLRGLDPSVPEVALSAGDFPLVRDQLGPGYGAPTPAGREAVDAAAASGLALDTTYTGKCLAAVLARGSHLGADGPVLFWNTMSSVDPAAQAPRPPSLDALPARLRRLVEPAPQETP